MITVEKLEKGTYFDDAFKISFRYDPTTVAKAKNGGSQQGKALRFLKAPVKIGLSGTPMNKAEDLWNILTWLGVERRSFYSFRNAYCTMGGFLAIYWRSFQSLPQITAL